MLPRAHRLTKRGDYARVRHHGRSRAHPLLILVVAPNGGETTRVGLVVGKRIGTAVVRNRVKRLLREAARARVSCLPPGYDIVLIARQEAAGAGLGDITVAVDTLLQRERLLTGRNRSDGQ